MSMISSLIDELNKSADEWNSSNMFELARMCREAADTIWQLRDDLQRTNAEFNAENAKLREERDMYRDLVGMMDHPDLNAQLQAENAKLQSSNEVIAEDHAALCEHNAKLRELCSKLAQVVANDDVTFRKLREIAKRELGYDFIGAYDSSLGDMDQLPFFSDHMRELGVEVDG